MLLEFNHKSRDSYPFICLHNTYRIMQGSCKVNLQLALYLLKGRNISSFWNWMRGRLLPALYDTRWYNGWIFEYDEGFLGNRELFMVGMPRLRQIRVKTGKLLGRM